MRGFWIVGKKHARSNWPVASYPSAMPQWTF